MNKIIINLNPSQPSIQGQYTNGDDVLVMCDATDGDFSITMPDVDSSKESTFRFVKKDDSLHEVTLVGKPNQKIMNEDDQVLTEEADELVLNSDGTGWW